MIVKVQSISLFFANNVSMSEVSVSNIECNEFMFLYIYLCQEEQEMTIFECIHP